jgi:hypothetical protein
MVDLCVVNARGVVGAIAGTADGFTFVPSAADNGQHFFGRPGPAMTRCAKSGRYGR